MALGVVVVTGILSSACAQYSGTLASQVSQWSTMTQFPSQSSTLQGDIRHIDSLGPHPDPGVLRTLCDVLVTDSLNANQNLPTPDNTLTGLLSDAYSLDGAAGRNCFSGAGGNATLLARSSTGRAAGRREMVKALARIDDLGPA
jgi:hypothetical protein